MTPLTNQRQTSGRELSYLRATYRAMPLRLLLTITVGVVAGDFLAALITARLPFSTGPTEYVIDAAISAIIIFPMLYFFLFRPAQKYTYLLEKTQQNLGTTMAELERTSQELEMRVRERTEALAQANQSLLAENQIRMQAEEGLQQRNQELQVLQSASMALTQSLDVHTVMETLLDRVVENFPVDGVVLFLVADPNHLEAHAYRGADYPQLEGNALPVTLDLSDHPSVRAVLSSRKAYWVDDTAIHASWKPIFGKANTRTWLGVPIMGSEQVIGVCVLENAQPGAFTERSVALAESLTGQAAVAVNNAWLFDQVRTGRERLRALSRRLVEAQEKERRYIARELHDETSQALVYLKIVLELLKGDVNDPEKVKSGVAELDQRIEDVLENLHRLTADLRPASLDHLGLAPALRQFIENVTSKQSVQIQLEFTDCDERLPADMEISLYRIIQEGLTNVIRHAKATHADVHIIQDQSKISLRIVDDGVGFNWDEALRKERLGLLGMRERAEMLGGALRVDTAEGCGTQILIEIPYVHSNRHR